MTRARSLPSTAQRTGTLTLEDRQTTERVLDVVLVNAYLVEPKCGCTAVNCLEIAIDLHQLGVLERGIVRPRVRDEKVNGPQLP